MLRPVRDSSFCCDGRCLEPGAYCPQQDACPTRAAGHDAECGVITPMVQSKLGAHLRTARTDAQMEVMREAVMAEVGEALEERRLRDKWLVRGALIVGAVATGAVIAAWTLV